MLQETTSSLVISLLLGVDSFLPPKLTFVLILTPANGSGKQNLQHVAHTQETPQFIATSILGGKVCGCSFAADEGSADDLHQLSSQQVSGRLLAF